jgi:hypothetical protein
MTSLGILSFLPLQNSDLGCDANDLSKHHSQSLFAHNFLVGIEQYGHHTLEFDVIFLTIPLNI